MGVRPAGSMHSASRRASDQKKKEKLRYFPFFLCVVGALLQVDGFPPACSQISGPLPKSTEEEAEQRLPIFAPGAANARSDLVSEQQA